MNKIKNEFFGQNQNFTKLFVIDQLFLIGRLTNQSRLIEDNLNEENIKKIEKIVKYDDFFKVENWRLKKINKNSYRFEIFINGNKLIISKNKFYFKK